MQAGCMANPGLQRTFLSKGKGSIKWDEANLQENDQIKVCPCALRHARALCMHRAPGMEALCLCLCTCTSILHEICEAMGASCVWLGANTCLFLDCCGRFVSKLWEQARSSFHQARRANRIWH